MSMGTGSLSPMTASGARMAARRRSPARGLLVGCGVFLSFTLGAAWVAEGQLKDLFAELDTTSLQRADDTADALFDVMRARLIASVQILSEDTRIRSTAMTTGFDEQTIRDVLDDLKRSSDASVLAVLDERGKVRAVTGAEGLRGMDLGSSPVIKAAQERPSTNFWTLPDQVLFIAVAPIRAGPRVSALLLMGLPIGKPQMAAIERATGVAGAIFVGDRLLASSTDDPAMAELFHAANATGVSESLIVPGVPKFLLRSRRTSESATAAKLVWAAPRHWQTHKIHMLRIATWMPALFGIITFGLALFATRKRNGGIQ